MPGWNLKAAHSTCKILRSLVVLLSRSLASLSYSSDTYAGQQNICLRSMMLNKPEVPQAHACYQIKQSNECRHVTANPDKTYFTFGFDQCRGWFTTLWQCGLIVIWSRSSRYYYQGEEKNWHTSSLEYSFFVLHTQLWSMNCMMIKAHHKRYCHSGEIILMVPHMCDWE